MHLQLHWQIKIVSRISSKKVFNLYLIQYLFLKNFKPRVIENTLRKNNIILDSMKKPKERIWQ